MDIVFLDASILFSASYRPKAKLVKLWQLTDIRLVTSRYAAEEGRWNLPDASSETVELVPTPTGVSLPEGIELPAKDVPILLGAIAAKATHLLTSDSKHFGQYYWQVIDGCDSLAARRLLQTDVSGIVCYHDADDTGKAHSARPRHPMCVSYLRPTAESRGSPQAAA
jgi:uncharacterized protein